MTTGKETLSQRIADVLTTVPITLDPEEDPQDETSAKVDTIDEYEEEKEERSLSHFRKLNVDLLSDVDKRYAGRRSSRRDLMPDSDDSDTEEYLIGDQSESEKENGSDEEFSDNENIEEEDVREEGNFQQLRDTDTSQQVHKGFCVKNQLKIWEDLLEMRIQIQKSLVAANKMPQGDNYKKIQDESGDEFVSKVTETKTNLCVLLDKLLLLQNLLHKQYPETKMCNKTIINEVDVDDDEEIPSETEDDNKAQDIEEPPQKRLHLEEYEGEIKSQHDNYKDYRNNVIKKWHEKTRLAMLRTAENTDSILNHIEHILSNRERLIKRTQLKRSEYQIVGEEKREAEHNSEIFDDDDFYHQLLRELIEVKSADLTDPVQLGRQWVRLQNLRSKMKRKIDTRATKGRKIRNKMFLLLMLPLLYYWLLAITFPWFPDLLLYEPDLRLFAVLPIL